MKDTMNIITKLLHRTHDYKRTFFNGHVPLTVCTSCGHILAYGRIK